MLLAREADGVVLSVLLGVSQIARISETVNRLRAVGAVVAGVVVNNVRCDVHHHKLNYRSKYPAVTVQKPLPELGYEATGVSDDPEHPDDVADEALEYAEECSEE
jgi:hypothetical protein